MTLSVSAPTTRSRIALGLIALASATSAFAFITSNVLVGIHTAHEVKNNGIPVGSLGYYSNELNGYCGTPLDHAEAGGAYLAARANKLYSDRSVVADAYYLANIAGAAVGGAVGGLQRKNCKPL